MADGSQSDRAGGRPTLPVNLLIGGWPCLVVGGGAVAHRKASALLAGRATVRVVSPVLCPALEALAADGRVEHVPRRFDPADAAGMRIVFAATNDRAVNRQVLEASRSAGALCCCADGNWSDGDFVTPATLQRDGLTVAVSTGGRSCRQARLVKETLGRHMHSIATADLLILGASHVQLPLETREAVYLEGAALREAGDRLMHVWGIHEFMLLVTCNRVELAAIASVSAAQCGLLERALGFDRLGPGAWYRLTGPEAFEHLALVTAGMLSQSPGEYHAASQVKASLETAVASGWANGMMQAWVAEALHISKHIKNEVAPLLAPVEIEEGAVAYAAARLGDDWNGRTVMILGAGTLGRRLVEKTLERNGRCVWCYHVNRPVPEPEWSGRVSVIPLDEMEAKLAGCDLVFAATGRPDPVLREEHAAAFGPERPLLIVDLGMPRNVSPALIPLLPGAELADLDRLKAGAANGTDSLERAMVMSREVVEQHRKGYDALITQFQGRNPGQ